MDELKYLGRQAAKGVLSRRDFMGRASALGLTAAAASSMLASAVKAEGPKKGGHIKVGSVGGESTNTQDPALALTQVAGLNLRQWGNTLTGTTPEGVLEGILTDSIEPSADAKTWSFKIRKGVEFHNGKSLTPDDVLKTFQRHSDENAKSGALGVMKGIESMKVDGDYLIITAETPNADLPYLLSDYHLVIQPDGGIDAPAAGIGTGPFKLEDDQPGVRTSFVRNENHWDGGPHVDSCEILTINDATARTAALQSGQVHMANRVEPKVAALLGRAPGVVVKNVSGRAHYVFLMHCNTAPFDNNDLRLALKYAINREEMVDKILRGYGTIGNDFPINTAYPLFDDAIPQRSYDPEKAKFHYKKSGHDGSPIVLQTSDVAFPGALDASQLFQQSAAAAGIPLELKREPGDGYWSEVWNKQPFCASYWGGRPVQDQMYATAYLSTADWNDTRFMRDDFDKLLMEARGELDNSRRKELYSQMAYMVRDEGGVILPMFNDFIDAISDRFEGYVDHPSGELMNGFAPSRVWFA